MNEMAICVVAAAPDGSGWGLVDWKESRQRCYFDPFRFMAPWPLPTIGARVLIGPGVNGLIAVWMVGA